jgi:hypothetical protein
MTASDGSAAEAAPNIDTNAESPAVATSVFISLLFLLVRCKHGFIRRVLNGNAGTE